MKPKTIIILGVLLLLCVGLIVVRKSGLLDKKQPATQPSAIRDVLAQKVGEARHLTIAAADGTTLAFEKSGEDWRIVQPVRGKAESWRVSSLADSLKDLQGEAVSDVAGEVTGLDKPRWTLTLVDDKGVSHGLEIGLPRPLESGQTYVRPKGGQQVFVVKRDFGSDLRKPVSEYRSKSIIDAKSDQLAGAKVIGKETYELSKATSGDWSIAYEGQQGKADAEKVRSLLDKFAGLTVEKFVSDGENDLSAYGLSKGKERLVFTAELKSDEPASQPATQPTTQAATQPAKPARTITLRVGNLVDKNAFATIDGEGLVFQVKASMLEDLQPKAVELRDKAVATFASDDVERVEVTLGGQAVELKKANFQWRMVKPIDAFANSQAVRSLVSDLAGLEAKEFPDQVKLAAYGLTKPAGGVVLHVKGKSEPVRLEVGSRSGSGELVYIKSAGGPGVAAIEAGKLQPASFYDTLLAQKPAGTVVEKLTLKRPDATLELVRAEGKWKMVQPVQAEVDQAVAERLAMGLERMKADTVAAVGDLPKQYAEAADHVTVTVDVRDLPKRPPATQPASAPATQPAATPAPDPASKPAAKPATQPAPRSEPKPAPATQPAPKVEAPKSKSYVVHVVKVGEKAYAWVEGDKPLRVGEVPVAVYNDLAGEMRPRKALSIAADDVDQLKIVTSEGKTHEFRKDKDVWVYVTDSFIKIDPEKVKTYVKDAVDVSVEKYVYNPPALQAAAKVTVELKAKGQTHRLVVLEQAGPGKDSRYGSASGVKELVLWSGATVETLAKSLDDFRKKDDAPAGPPPGMPPHGLPGGMGGMRFE
ncbi:MAG: hypothetical protein BWX88_04685 [Planctomycetes bacterium ADurb.Bin126]|nr:MAG: hypothetical protein BWX88_04685 [Planctomycetes bacterium ADurb.Bin126]HOD82803.1 DUF4340 domain-containing protein [Phycisphaerae bacterium]HQL75224.1 DUF4340 domain-containing protein [Phycisphaerae bacterium]